MHNIFTFSCTVLSGGFYALHLQLSTPYKGFYSASTELALYVLAPLKPSSFA